MPIEDDMPMMMKEDEGVIEGDNGGVPIVQGR